MKKLILILGIIFLMGGVQASYDDIYSLYLERSNHIHEVQSGRAEYNPEYDKSLGIQIDYVCFWMGRTNPRHCWYNMLFQLGMEFRPYRGF